MMRFQAIKLCGCVDPQNYFTSDQLRSVNFTICGNQTSILYHLWQSVLNTLPSVAIRPQYFTICGNQTSILYHLWQSVLNTSPSVAISPQYFTICGNQSSILHHLWQSVLNTLPSVAISPQYFTICGNHTSILYHLWQSDLNTLPSVAISPQYFTICGNQSSIDRTADDKFADDLRGFQDLVCLASIKNDQQPVQCSMCLRSCFERRYTTQVSASGPWPNPVFQLDFFRRFIQKKSYAARFYKYAELSDAVTNGSLTSVSY